LNNIAIFADVQNIYYTTRDAYGRQFDYRKVWQHIAKQGDIKIANAYAVERNDSKQKKFQLALHQIGFTVKLKPYIQRSDGSSKGDWDVGITIDVMEAAPDMDTIVLLSGDGDFALLLEKIKTRYNVHTHVFGVPALTAGLLIQQTDSFSAITDTLLL